MSSIFLSHNRRDKPFALRLANALKNYGVKVWLDEAEMKVGDSLISKIQSAIKEMDYLGVILSPDSVASEWVKKELEIALNQEISGKRVKVLPFLARNCQIPTFLEGKVYADFRKENDWDKAVKLIIKALGIDERDTERLPGKRVILMDDFINGIYDYFSPSNVEIEFLYDYSGIEYIKVNNDDRTFELYQYWTKPTHIDLINKIFRKANQPKIKDIKIREECIIKDSERQEKLNAICIKYGFPEDSYPAKWEETSTDKKKMGMALKEWNEYLDGKWPVFFIH